MPDNKKLLLLPGDGIGPEIVNEVRKIISWMDKRRSVTFDITEGLIGGAAIDATGGPLPDKTLEAAHASDAVLMGAAGGPKWETLPFEVQPERGLLGIRKELGLFANLRPAIVFDALADASTLKLDVVKGLDIMIERELTGGIYFGEGVVIEDIGDGILNLEFQSKMNTIGGDVLAGLNKACSVDKANVLEVSELWREVMEEVSSSYPDVTLSHMYVDNAAMQLVRDPKQFDVMVTS